MKSGKRYQFIACFLIALILFSSLGIAVDLHYCRGELKSFRFFGQAENCHQTLRCPNHPSKSETDTQEMEQSCCNNEFQYLFCPHEHELHNSVPLETASDHPAFVSVITNYEVLGADLLAYSQNLYKPPLVQKDISVLYESYLL